MKISDLNVVRLRSSDTLHICLICENHEYLLSRKIKTFKSFCVDISIWVFS